MHELHAQPPLLAVISCRTLFCASVNVNVNVNNLHVVCGQVIASSLSCSRGCAAQSTVCVRCTAIGHTVSWHTPMFAQRSSLVMGRVSRCYTEKASPTRHRPDRQHNPRSNRRKQCSPNETKPYSKPTPPRKRQTTPTNGHTPRRMGTCHVRIWQLSGKMQCLMPQQCKSAALEITLHMYLTLGSRETHALTPYACPSLINRKADSASWTFMVW